jgi:hypothetical protein
MIDLANRFLNTSFGNKFENLAKANNWTSGPVYVNLFDGNISLDQKNSLLKPYVTYNLNSNRYRAIEFHQVDWKNTVVLFGCSNTFGEGLNEDDTISARLSCLINKPVLNLGVSSSSMLYSLYNSALLHKYFTPPKAVVQLWTEYSRVTYFNELGLEHLGTWNYKNKNYFDLWNQNEHNSKSQAYFIRLIAQQLWQEKSLYYEATHFVSTADILNCDILDIVDTALDIGRHPGPKSAQLAAEKIAKNLNI